MKAAKTSKKLKEMLYPPQKKLLKRKGNNITLESGIIGGVGRIGRLDIVIIINNREVGWGSKELSTIEKIDSLWKFTETTCVSCLRNS